jgi:hypothetical protein
MRSGGGRYRWFIRVGVQAKGLGDPAPMELKLARAPFDLEKSCTYICAGEPSSSNSLVMHASLFNVVATEYKLMVPSTNYSSWSDARSRQLQH